MPLYKATAQGQVQMTAKEESDFLAEQSERDSVPNKKAKIRALINEEKKSKENKGVTVNGVLYSTDFTSRLELSNAYIYLVRNPQGTVNLESKDGDIVELNMAGIEAVFDAVNSYISSVAIARKTHFENVRLLNKDNVDSYDVKSLWP